ncbi:MAG: competence/damage-inducible protein A [Micavibrio sp.]|nr:competence/damage-inducible protein A [Micavibrio sp.]
MKESTKTNASNYVSAAVIVIGDEILSGRTQDTNSRHIALRLGEIGIQLGDIRVVPDREDTIISAVNEMRTAHSYVFTTGGIGPTHDDITAACIAKAFNQKFVRNEWAYKKLLAHYGEENLTDARLRMAMMPENVEIIENIVSGAPGFKIENVYVMAGVPKIMEAMMDAILPTLKGGDIIHSETVPCPYPESQVASFLADLQDKTPAVSIGSYPHLKDGKLGVNIVLRSANTQKLASATSTLKLYLENGGPTRT